MTYASGLLLLTPLDTKISEIRDSAFVALKTPRLLRHGVGRPAIDRTARPVIDALRRLVGIVTIRLMCCPGRARHHRKTPAHRWFGIPLEEPYNNRSRCCHGGKKRRHVLVIPFLGEMLTRPTARLL